MSIDTLVRWMQDKNELDDLDERARQLEEALATINALTEQLELVRTQYSGQVQKPEITSIEPALDHVVSSVMTSTEIIALLTEHGCTDLTTSLDESSSSLIPIPAGGQSNVFRGRLDDGTTVAIKTLRADGSSEVRAGRYQKRTAREIYTWSKCSHRNIVRLSGLALFRGSLAMVSLWEENGNLNQYLLRHRDADRCELSKAICTGLAYLHENGIVHGDLKGANILVAQDGTPMLMDFGNAYQLGGTLQFTQTTTQAAFTLQWTAPEILRGKTGHTTAADIYALGMTIMETFTGQVPYANKPAHAVLRMVVVKKKIPTRPGGVIPERSIYGDTLWALLKSCWSYNPKGRPSAEAVRNATMSLTAEMLEAIGDEPEEEDEDDDDD